MRDMDISDNSRGRSRASRQGGEESMLNPDLQDWLKMTDWHNEDYRHKKLSQYRLAQLDKQDREADTSSDDYTNGHAIKADRSSVETSSGLARKKGGGRDNGYIGRDHASSRGRSVSPRRLGGRPDELYNYRGRDYPQECGINRYGDIPKGPRLVTSTEHGPRRHLSLVEVHQYDRPMYGKGEWVDGKRDPDREMAMLELPKKLDVAGNDEVLFFNMRSYSWDNVYDCMDNGLWATQGNNIEALTKAFTTAKTVILFFSVNKSHGIQGYAKMKSLPSANMVRPRWWYEVRWNISDPFEVEWLCKANVDSTHMYHLNNALNDNLPVTRARDGQQIDPDTGRQMMAIMESRAVQMVKHAKRGKPLTAQ